MQAAIGKTQEIQRRCRDTTEAMVASTKDATNKIQEQVAISALNSATTMEAMLADVEKNTKETAKKATEHVANMFDTIDERAAHSHKKIKESLSEHHKNAVTTTEAISAMTIKSLNLQKALESEHSTAQSESLRRVALLSSNLGHKELAGIVVRNTGRGAIEAVKEMPKALGEISSVFTKMVPQLTAIASVTALLANVAEAITRINEKTAEWAKEVGGDTKIAYEFYNRMQGLKEVTYSSGTSLEKLGLAFQEAGMNAIEGGKGVDDYIVLASKMQRIFGTSSEELGKYMAHLRESGYSVEQAHVAYDKLYVSMQGLTLTLGDLNDAMSEGFNAWTQYGYIGGQSLVQMQQNIIETKGLFKSLNIDVKDTASAMSSLFGDPKMQRRQAALIANQTGMSGIDAFNTLLMDPAKGKELLLKSELKQMMAMPGAHFDMSSEQLKGLSSDQQYGALNAQQHAVAIMERQFGAKPEQFGPMLAKYRAFQKSNPGGSVDQFFDWAAQDRPKEVGTGIESAFESDKKSLGSSLSHFGESLQTPINAIASKISELLPVVTGGINNLVSFANTISSHFNLGWHPEVMKIAEANALSISGGVAKAAAQAMKIPGTSAMVQDPMSLYYGTSNAGPAKPVASEAMLGTPMGAPLSIPSLEQLNRYRKDQGMAPTRSWHPHMMQNAAVVMDEARRAGADPATAIATMLRESGGNEGVHGDFGYFTPSKKHPGRMIFHPDNVKHPKHADSSYHSGGLMQLFDHGKGYGMSEAEWSNPRLNARRSVAEMATLRKNHPDWDEGLIAARSQRPADQAAYRQGINSMIPLAKQIIQLLESQNQHLAEEKNDRKEMHKDLKRAALVSDNGSGSIQKYLHQGVV